MMYFKANILVIIGLVVVMECKPQGFSFPEEPEEGLNRIPQNPAFSNGMLPPRPPSSFTRPQQSFNQNNRPQQSFNQNNPPQQSFNQNNRPQQLFSQNNRPQQPFNQNNRPQQTTTSRPAQTEAATSSTSGSTSSTILPPRDPANRIVYLVSCPCTFTYQYAPVCGTDGQTYGNAGVLQCAISCGTNVKVYREGACRQCSVPGTC